jgi:peptide/nickel transport system substrate-binding protein
MKNRISGISKIITLTLFICLLALTGACGGGDTPLPDTSSPVAVASPSQADENVPTEESAGEEQELIIGDRSIALSLDPTVSNDSNYLVKIGAGEMLFKADKNGAIQPLLAESAEQSDATHWSVKLRQGISFWSGKVVNADAVIASLERSREMNARANSFLSGITLAKADDYEILIETEAENMLVPLNLSSFQLIIHNADMDYADTETTDLTGMYKIDEYIPSQSMRLSINDTYWGVKPVIGTVIYEQISDDQARTVAALSGRYHIMLNIPTASIQQFDGSDDAVIVSQTTDSTQTIYLNLQRPQLSDARVRQALSWALDREELIIFGAEGHSSPVTTWMGSNPQFSDAKSIFFDGYNLDKAGTLLDEAGWELGSDGVRRKEGEALTVHLMTWGTEKTLGEAIQAQWKKLGIDAQVSHGEYDQIMTARDTGDWDASIEAWSTFGNPAAMLNAQYFPGGGGNYGGFDDALTNNLLDRLALAENDDARHELVLELSERVAELSPAIYLFPRPGVTAISSSLIGFEPHFRQIENVVTADLRIQ